MHSDTKSAIVANWLLVIIGTMVAGSEVGDLFIEEKNFTVDHFSLGTGLIILGAKKVIR